MGVNAGVFVLYVLVTFKIQSREFADTAQEMWRQFPYKEGKIYELHPPYTGDLEGGEEISCGTVSYKPRWKWLLG